MKITLDHFFQLHWRRINHLYDRETIARHEEVLMKALYNRRDEITKHELELPS